jgi:hypothetical protein
MRETSRKDGAYMTFSTDSKVQGLRALESSGKR